MGGDEEPRTHSGHDVSPGAVTRALSASPFEDESDLLEPFGRSIVGTPKAVLYDCSDLRHLRVNIWASFPTAATGTLNSTLVHVER